MRDVPQGQCPDCWPDACYTGCHFHCGEGYDLILAERDAMAAELERLRPLIDALDAWDHTDYCSCEDTAEGEALIRAWSAYQHRPKVWLDQSITDVGESDE